MPAPDAAALLRSNAADPERAGRPALRFGEEAWTHRSYYQECGRWASWMAASRPEVRPFHLGVLADNLPDYLFALGGAALSGSTIVGLNHTRAGEHLRADLLHTDVDAVLTEPRHLDALAGLDLGDRPVVVTHRWDDSASDGDADLDEVLAATVGTDPGDEPGPEARWALVFTSGSSGAPKAVICTQRRMLITGNRMSMVLGIDADDVGYICMPLFHSNALMVGWAPSIVVGASVGLARRFSASGWLPDVRRYGATWFNYTGKPLSYLVATPEAADDADNPLRVAFGNEGSPQVIDAFAERFDVEVIDAFGSTEGAIGINRDVEVRRGAVGVAGPTIAVVDESGEPCPAARFDEAGHLLNAAEAVGEIVNTAGAGPFEGYYGNDEATAAATRNGWYWSGDLGYLDADRYLYFAGRTGDWLRVDGENFPAQPVLDALVAHPDVVVGAVYAVPDVHAGDQVMAALVLRDGTTFDGAAFAGWVDAHADLGPKWRPRYLRLGASLPTTGTNKVLTRELRRQKYRLDQVGSDELWVRERGEPAYRRFTHDDEAALQQGLDAAGRSRFWDL